MGFSRQEYWSGFSFAPPEDLPNLGIEALSLFFTTSTTWEVQSQCHRAPIPLSVKQGSEHLLYKLFPWWNEILYGKCMMWVQFSSVQFSHSVMSDSLRPHELQHARPPCPSPTPGVTQTHVHQVSDAIQPTHPLSPPSPPAPNPSQHQSLFQWVKSSHEVAKVLEFQL